MRVIWLGHCTYLVISLVIFFWTLSYQSVSLSDFQVPLLEYAAVAGAVVVCAALPLIFAILVRLITDADKRRSMRIPFDATVQRRVWQYLVCLAPPVLAFIVTMGSFAVHKANVLPSMGYSWDAAFMVWDRWFFWGRDPWQITHSLFSTPQATWLIDQLYHNWFYPMFIFYGFCVLMIRAPVVRICYIASYLISWLVIGTLLAGIFVSAGPAYDGLIFGDGETYAALMSRLNEQAGLVGGLDALKYQAFLYDGYQSQVAAVGLGISAMPSMHIALAVMWMLLLFNVNRWLGVIGIVYVVLIWIGSIHLGWHYAVDGLASAVIVLLIWFAMHKLLSAVPKEKSNDSDYDAKAGVAAEMG